MHACLTAEALCLYKDLQHTHFAPPADCGSILLMSPILIIGNAQFCQHDAAPLCVCFGTKYTATLSCCCSVLQRLLRRNPLAAMSLHKPVSRAPSQALLGTIPYGLQPVGEFLPAPRKQALKARPASCKGDLLWHACRSCQSCCMQWCPPLMQAFRSNAGSPLRQHSDAQPVSAQWGTACLCMQAHGKVTLPPADCTNS